MIVSSHSPGPHSGSLSESGKIGENVQIRRFTRYTLGEGIEVEQTDFAAEVAAMTISA
jgi:translation elongation factor EF-Ts